MRLSTRQLRARCDPSQFEFDDTASLGIASAMPGQSNAMETIRFAARLPQGGFNLFVVGSPETGKQEATFSLLQQIARDMGDPDDWCYVNNFREPARPVALRLPCGQGRALRKHLEQLVDELRTAIPAVFESEEYHARVGRIDAQFSALQERTFSDLVSEARSGDVALWRTPTGFSFAPTRNGEAIPPEAFEQLPGPERERFRAVIAELQDKLERLLRQVVAWRRERRAALRKLNEEVTVLAVGTLVDDLIRHYVLLPRVVAYLEALRRDVIENAELFQQGGESPAPEAAGLQVESLQPLRRYQVNLVASRDAGQGAPVIVEESPGLSNLVGRVEYLARLGALVTDFGMIKSGAMHRACGGFLLLDARRVLMQAFAWEGLKRALISREIRIESLGQLYGLTSTVTLEPDPIPFEAKVVLFGDRSLYALLQQFDPDFGELFKIAPDFQHDMPRERGALDEYVRWVAAMARDAAVRPLDREAVAGLLDWSSRQAGDRAKLSLQVRRVRDLLVEADHWAHRAGRSRVSGADVDRAIRARIERSDALRLRMHERILNDTVLIDTAGAQVGQVNGLAVVMMGDVVFGLPTRITATTRLGDGAVVDIQRESNLGGSLHTKGVMILSSWLAARYGTREPLSLAASLVFEQTYGAVDGDSASLAELCALLSSLSGLALRQGLAVTGSVNQKGEVQAIGGVNEKIEGFFDLCRARGLSADHGVLIPESNRRHLMLRDDIVAEVAAGRFAVLAVRTVEEALAWLVSVGPLAESIQAEAAMRRLDDRVRARLREYGRLRQRFGGVGPARRARKS